MPSSNSKDVSELYINFNACINCPLEVGILIAHFTNLGKLFSELNSERIFIFSKGYTFSNIDPGISIIFYA